jgi:hypothetical protein
MHVTEATWCSRDAPFPESRENRVFTTDPGKGISEVRAKFPKILSTRPNTCSHQAQAACRLTLLVKARGARARFATTFEFEKLQ